MSTNHNFLTIQREEKQIQKNNLRTAIEFANKSFGQRQQWKMTDNRKYFRNA